MLDALGTKGIWKNKDAKKRLQEWNGLIDFFQTNFSDELKTKNLKSEFYVFSDTVIITVIGDGKEHGDVENNLLEILSHLTRFFCISLTWGFLFRGCASLGFFVSEGNSILGPTIDEAAEYHEMPQWIGISLTPSAHKIYDKIAGHLSYTQYVPKYPFAKFDIPLKIGVEKNGYALNWPPLNDFMKHISTKFSEDRNIKLYNLIKKELESTNDINVVLKLRNTLNYFDEIKSRF